MRRDQNVEAFIESMKRERGISPHTESAYRGDLKQLSEFLGGKEEDPCWSQVSQEQLEKYAKSLTAEGKYSTGTAARKIYSARSFFSHLEETGIIPSNPSRRIKPPTISRRSPESLTKDEIRTLIRQASQNKTSQGARDKAIIRLICDAGLQPHEIVSLNLEDLNSGRNSLKCHSNGAREIPITTGTACILQRYIKETRPALAGSKPETPALFISHNGERLSRQWIWKTVKELANAAGIAKEINPNVLRQSSAAHLMEAGEPVEKLKEKLGHSSGTVTRNYARLRGPAHPHEPTEMKETRE